MTTMATSATAPAAAAAAIPGRLGGAPPPREGLSFARAVLNTYEQAAGARRDYKLGLDGWVALMQACGAQFGLSLKRDHLEMMFEAARSEGSPTVDIREMLRMPSVAKYFAEMLRRVQLERAQAMRQAEQMQAQAMVIAQAQAVQAAQAAQQQADAAAAAAAQAAAAAAASSSRTPARGMPDPQRQQRPLRAMETSRSGPAKNRFVSFTPELMSSVEQKSKRESPGSGAMEVLPTGFMRAAAAALGAPVTQL